MCCEPVCVYKVKYTFSQIKTLLFVVLHLEQRQALIYYS